MAGAVTAISRLLVGVGATLIGGALYSKQANESRTQSEPSTTAKVLNALLSDSSNNNQNQNNSQQQPPQPPQPVNMTVHVPNPKQNNWTWTLIFASFGVGATVILYYFNKDKVIHRKLGEIFAFQKKSNDQINDTIRKEVNSSASRVQGSVATHVGAVKSHLNQTDNKIQHLHATTQNIHDTTHRTQNAVQGLREDTTYYANKMITNQNRHFSNINNSLQHLSNQNLAVMGRLLQQIEQPVPQNGQFVEALPAPPQRALTYAHPPVDTSKLGNEFLALGSPRKSQSQRPQRSNSVSASTRNSSQNRSQSFHNTPKPQHYDGRRNSGSHMGLNGPQPMPNNFRSVPQTPVSHIGLLRENQGNYGLINGSMHASEAPSLSPINTVHHHQRQSTMSQDTIVRTHELVQNIHQTSFNPQSPLKADNKGQGSGAAISIDSAKNSGQQSPKGWNKWFSGL